MSEFQRAILLWARHLARAGKLIDIVDHSIQDMDKEQALVCITIVASHENKQVILTISSLDEIQLDKIKAFEKDKAPERRSTIKSHENLLFDWQHSGKEGDLVNAGKDCRVTSTTEEQSNLILEDDEPSLLMTMHETKHEEVLLNEGQIQPGKYASGDASIWYLDNGASNHMTGVKSHFRDINESVTGRVHFGDGSYVQIKGRGSILLGHLNFDDINKMTRKGLVDGIPRINHAEQIYDACLLGKHSRTPFPNQAKFRSKNPLDLVYGDLCGPISPATHQSKNSYSV
ncbi:hypothetical protein Tco_0599658 [Tanacetum coccineum]